jgi:hypothetical protein
MCNGLKPRSSLLPNLIQQVSCALSCALLSLTLEHRQQAFSILFFHFLCRSLPSLLFLALSLKRPLFCLAANPSWPVQFLPSRCHPLQHRSFAIPRIPEVRLDQKLVGFVSACFPRHDAPVKESILSPPWCPFHLEILSPPSCSILNVSSHELSVTHRKAGRTLIWHYTPGSCIGLRSLISPGRKQRPSPQQGVGLRLRRMLPALPAEPVRRISP